MLLLGFDAHPSPDRGLFPLIPAHGLGGRETSNFLPLLIIQSIHMDFGSSPVRQKKKSPRQNRRACTHESWRRPAEAIH
jgi:hypothetical protein